MGLRERVSRLWRSESAETVPVDSPVVGIGLPGGRRHRVEATSRVGSSGQDKDAPPTFIPDLIKEEAWERTDLGHLKHVAREDPIAYFLCHTMAKTALADWFEFVDPKDGRPILKEVQTRLRQLGAKPVAERCLSTMRWAGHAWMYVGMAAVREEAVGFNPVSTLDWFTPQNCVVVEYDDMGRPSLLEITVIKGGGRGGVLEDKIELPASDFIHWRTDPYDRSEKGRPVLWSIWDTLNYIRYTLHAQAWYDLKIGLGAFLVRLGVTLSDEIKSALQTMMEDISVKRSIIVDKRVEEMKFLNADGASNAFGEHLDSLYGQVAAGTSIAKDIITGVSAGAITGSEINVKSLYAAINQIQKSIEPYIRELVRRMGVKREDYEIRWKLKFAHDELEKAQIDYLASQTLINELKVKTINEKRAELGLPGISDGDRLIDDISIGLQPSGSQSPEAQDRTRNPTGENT